MATARRAENADSAPEQRSGAGYHHAHQISFVLPRSRHDRACLERREHFSLRLRNLKPLFEDRVLHQLFIECRSISASSPMRSQGRRPPDGLPGPVASAARSSSLSRSILFRTSSRGVLSTSSSPSTFSTSALCSVAHGARRVAHVNEDFGFPHFFQRCLGMR